MGLVLPKLTLLLQHLLHGAESPRGKGFPFPHSPSYSLQWLSYPSCPTLGTEGVSYDSGYDPWELFSDSSCSSDLNRTSCEVSYTPGEYTIQNLVHSELIIQKSVCESRKHGIILVSMEITFLFDFNDRILPNTMPMPMCRFLNPYNYVGR